MPIIKTDDLDQAIAMLLRQATEPLTIPELERLVAMKTPIKADTYDVQRAVHRLLEKGQAILTPRLAIMAKAS